MDVAQIMRAVDNPEFLVAGGEVENLFVLGQHDQRRATELGMDGDDIVLAVAVLHNPCATRCRMRQHLGNHHLQ